MGALYWQANDIWQAPTWSSTEYDGTWKILHNWIRHCFEDVHVSSFEEDNDLVIHVTSDLLTSVNGLLIIDVYSVSTGVKAKSSQQKFQVDSNSSALVFRNSIASVIGSMDPSDFVIVLTASYSTSNGKNNGISRNYHYPASFEHMKLAEPKLTVTIDEDELKIHVTSDVVALFVHLELTEGATVQGYFTENAAVVVPGMSWESQFVAYIGENGDVAARKDVLETLKSNLRVRSLWDVYRD